MCQDCYVVNLIKRHIKKPVKLWIHQNTSMMLTAPRCMTNTKGLMVKTTLEV